MTARRRVAALLLTGPAPAAAAPRGIDPEAFAAAQAEDLADLLASLAGIDAAMATGPDQAELARRVSWPGTHLLDLSHGHTPVDVLVALGELGYDEGAVLVADAPDLPALHVAKSFSALDTRAVAVAPARETGMVILASRLPVPDWLRDNPIDMDAADPVRALKAVASQRRDVFATPGWHRLRTPADLGWLDPGLEGWDATRALLSGLPSQHP